MLGRFSVLLPLLWAAPALAQPQPEPAPAEPPPAETPAAPEAQPLPGLPGEEAIPPPSSDIPLEEWSRDDWMLHKPSVSLLELDGYFRIRGDLFSRRIDFGNNAGIVLKPNDNGVLVSRSPYEDLGQTDADFQTSNMRLRLQPQINVTDWIHIYATVDVLDNIVLGETPNTVPPTGTSAPVNLLARSQNTAERNFNALTDSIVVKRAWGRVTALQEQVELQFGRMPNHWGLGMMTNSGDCLDCDYGDVADRIALTFRAANHLFIPMYDWVSSGPVTAPFGRTGGQPLDATEEDDVDQYSLRILRLDHQEDIADRVRQGDVVLNYGLWNIFRTQDREVTPEYWDARDPARPLAENGTSFLQNRDAFFYTVDAFGTLYAGPLTLSIEAAFVYGTFKDQLRTLSPTIAEPGRLVTTNTETTVLKWGAALEGSYQIPGQRAGSVITLKAGAASGDPTPGFGTIGFEDTQRTDRPGAETTLKDFQFSPDYHVDLLLFRYILGTVTDAWYARPGVTYMFDDRFAGTIAAQYAQALSLPKFQSTDWNPAAENAPAEPNITVTKLTRPMALEIDGEISYGLAGPQANADDAPLAASITGAIAFPFGAFDNPTLGEEDRGGSFAWALQANIYLRF